MVLLSSFLVFLAFFTAGNGLREAQDEEFPFQVSIQTIEKRHLCGGAIITPKWILTASLCLRNQAQVRIVYGTADSNKPLNYVESQKIVNQNDFNLLKKNRLAVIELQTSIKFSETVKQAKLPTPKAELRNTTKLCGWKITQGIDVPPSLYVIDSYYVIPKDCMTASGVPVALDMDEFCGMDEESKNYLYNPGTIVSKSGIVLGMLAESPLSPSQPYVFVKLSEHNQWIKDVLQSDAEYIKWAEHVPKDSALSHSAVSLTLLGISAIFIHFI